MFRLAANNLQKAGYDLDKVLLVSRAHINTLTTCHRSTLYSDCRVSFEPSRNNRQLTSSSTATQRHMHAAQKLTSNPR